MCRSFSDFILVTFYCWLCQECAMKMIKIRLPCTSKYVWIRKRYIETIDVVVIFFCGDGGWYMVTAALCLSAKKPRRKILLTKIKLNINRNEIPI